ncbi:hypothetical protein BDR07DRAFT_1531211 [Suillus spraguei]|nr:hypothetical protein BDR07DRAFT_1531211 [Suillus spraguei]
MRHARKKFQWVSARVTTWQEDVAYSLFGIFGVKLPVIHGEKKQSALGRLLQEVIARSGDISALDWVGNLLNSIAVCRPILLHTKLRHTPCHLCPKKTFRHQSPHSDMSWP